MRDGRPYARTWGGEEGGLDGEDGEAEGERQAQQQRHRRPPLRRGRRLQVGPRHRRIGGGAPPPWMSRGWGKRARRPWNVEYE